MKLIFNIILVLLIGLRLDAAYFVKVTDQVVERGKEYTLQVESDIQKPISSIEISFLYDATMLNIQKAIGGNTYILNDESNNISINLNENDYTKSVFTVKSSNVKENSSGLVCGILFKTSASAALESYVEPISLIIDGVEDKDIAVKKGVISNPIILKPTDLEYISQNFPNPFHTFTQFPIQIIDSTSLEISIYNFVGDMFAAVGKDESVISSKLYDSSGNIYAANKARYSLPKGRYKLFLDPVPYNFPSGAYIIFFKSDKEVHTLFFNYIK